MQPVWAIYDGLPRLVCPHALGRNREGRLRALCYQFGGSSGSGLQSVDKLSQVELSTGVWQLSHVALSICGGRAKLDDGVGAWQATSASQATRSNRTASAALAADPGPSADLSEAIGNGAALQCVQEYYLEGRHGREI